MKFLKKITRNYVEYYLSILMIPENGTLYVIF